jgi:uncharacterized protein
MNGPATDIPSPCVKVCVMDPGRGICVGCYRTLDEIAHWGEFTPAQRHLVWARIAERRKYWGPLPAGPA